MRSKELPYIDVLTESLNNPIRLFMGWFVLIPERLPPLSLGLAYWMMGALCSQVSSESMPIIAWAQSAKLIDEKPLKE